jgi:hypothetical protein
MMTLKSISRQSSFYYVQWQGIFTFIRPCSFCLRFFPGAPLPGDAGLGFLGLHPARNCEPREWYLQNKNTVQGRLVLSCVERGYRATKKGTYSGILPGWQVTKLIFTRNG